MNQKFRLAALAVLALVLTCLCLARPIRPHRTPHSGCVQRCGSYCRSLGMLTSQSCSSCTCYPPPVFLGGCEGGCYGGYGCSGYGGCSGGYSGCNGYGGCSGGDYGGCGGDGCGGFGGCGGGGCGGGC